jgi:hypothetical protein
MNARIAGRKTAKPSGLPTKAPESPTVEPLPPKSSTPAAKPDINELTRPLAEATGTLKRPEELQWEDAAKKARAKEVSAQFEATNRTKKVDDGVKMLADMGITKDTAGWMTREQLLPLVRKVLVGPRPASDASVNMLLDRLGVAGITPIEF